MANEEIRELTAETALNADDAFVLQQGTDRATRATWALTGGLELVNRDTDADFTMVVGEFYHVDISAWSNSGSGRTWTLPASANVGERIGVFLEAGDNTEHIDFTAASGDTLNGVAGGTDWSRVFITNECVIFRCVAADSTWVVEHDGRIPCKAEMNNAVTNNNYWTDGNWLKLPTDTVDYDVGDIADSTNNYFAVRRAGKYLVAGVAAFSGNASDAADAYFARVQNLDLDTIGLGLWMGSGSTNSYRASPAFCVTEVAAGEVGANAGRLQVAGRYIDTSGSGSVNAGTFCRQWCVEQL